ncbi:hypothetical protein, partial [Streptomyces halstedii]|uniref:hypothetical protein n=1 Tax=Streptomyces halstedii TaxID=1944 RepID=UPI0033537930
MSGPPKGSRKAKADPQAIGFSIRTGNGTDKESGKVGTAGKGNAKAKNWKAEERETRFDRESDTKESDR